ncbi:MAG: amidohydrolase family protein [bacterium]|nr:amidohydrolase family protein [bacterium]
MRINVHTHIFNLAVMTTPRMVEVVRERLAGEIDIDILGDVAADLVDDILEGIADLNEEALLRTVLRRLTGAGDFRSLLEDVADDVPRELRELLAGALEEESLGLLGRGIDWVIRRFRRRGDDFRRSDLHDILEALRIAAQADIAGVADWLMRQLDPADAAVALTLDITDGQGDDSEIWERQLQQTSDAIFAYPGRLLPFVAVNSLRPDHFEIMTNALEKRGYVGVKLYPSLGYTVDSDAMMRVYRYCHEHGVPLLMHCNRSGFVVSDDSFKNADPSHWRPILERFEGLKICFAHFGGSSDLTKEELPPESWARVILDLMQAHDGVYTDIAFHRAPMESDELAEGYFRRLSGFLDHPLVRDRVLFGTDFWLIRSRLSEANHWKFFEERLSAEHFKRIAEINTRRFLGLDGGNDAAQDFVDFVAARPDRIESPPAAWLLDAVGTRPGGAQARAALEAVAVRRSPARNFFVRLWRELLDQVASRTLAEGLDVDLEGDLDDLGSSFRGGTIGFEAGAGLAVKVFNAETFGDDAATDQDGVLLPHPDGESEIERLGRQVEPADGRAWLKYRVEARLAGDLDVESVGLGVNAEKSVVLTDYRAHRPDETLREAIRSDLTRPRFALSRSDVRRLGDGDAVGFELRGKLGGRVTLSWRDVFTSGIDVLAGVIPGASTIAVRVDAAASITARVTLEDDFRVVFSRHGEDFQAAVRKVKARGASFTGSLEVGVELDDPGVVRDALDQLVAEAVGEDLGALQALLERPEAGSSAEEELLDQLEERLQAAGLDEVRDALASLQDRLTSEIDDIARARIKAGFVYEYRRMETHATLLEARFPGEVLEHVHHQLVQGDLTGVLERAAEENPQVELCQFLRQRELTRRHSWGFSLGPLAGTDERKSVLREHQDAEDQKMIAFLGTRGYEASWDGAALWGWSVDLRADMAEFESAPKIEDFEYGLAVEMTWNRRLTKTALRQCIDAAVLWRALPEGVDAFAAAEQRFVEAGLRDKRVPIALELVFDHQALGSLLPTAAAAGDDKLAAALAAAMPYRKSASHGDPETRREAYEQTWFEYLRAEPARQEIERDWALLSSKRLRASGLIHQALMEHGNDNRWRDRLWTFGGMITINGSPSARLRDFRRGLRLLSAALGAGSDEPPESIETRLFQPLQRFWQQTHHVRALGVLLLDAARAAGTREGIRATLVAEITGNGRSEALILGQASR